VESEISVRKLEGKPSSKSGEERLPPSQNPRSTRGFTWCPFLGFWRLVRISGNPKRGKRKKKKWVAKFVISHKGEGECETSQTEKKEKYNVIQHATLVVDSGECLHK